MGSKIHLSNPTERQSFLNTIASNIVAPLIAAMVAGFASYVSVQKEMSSNTAVITQTSKNVEDIAKKQTQFFETFYMPMAIRVEKNDAKLEAVSARVDTLKDEMRLFHGGKNGRSGQ